MQPAPYAPRKRASTKRPDDGWSSLSLVKTGTPGIFRKPGAKTRPYVVVYRAAGKQRKESCRTMAEARAIKAARETDDLRGEFKARSKITLRAYLADWIETYQGNGRHGFREGTRVEYRRQLAYGAHQFFGERLRLTDITPLHLADFVRWLADAAKQNGRRYSDSSIANRVNPVRAALATAKRDGLIRHNPADGLALPNRQRIEEDDDNTTKALSWAQLRQLLEIAPDDYKLLIETLASTGLRISEAIALQRRDLQLDELRPYLRVRRAIVRGRVEPPKSKHGRRKAHSPDPSPPSSPPTWTPSSTAPTPPGSSPPKSEPHSTPTTSAHGSSSPSCARSAHPGRHGTPSATPTHPSNSPAAPTSSSSPERSATTPPASPSTRTYTCSTARMRQS